MCSFARQKRGAARLIPVAEIETAPPGTNPVARWVEAVQPWMPASGGDDAMLDVRETPDWTSRAKGTALLPRCRRPDPSN